jgi:Tol biopolymer transport system component
MKRIVANPRFRIIAGLLAIPVACSVICVVLALIPPPPPPEQEAQPSWSPDGQRLAYVCYLEGPTEGWSQFEITFNFNPPSPETPWSQYTSEAADICVIDSDGRNRLRLTQEPGEEWGPVWSPDGAQIAYLRRDGVYVIDADGRNQRQLVSGRVPDAERMAWSPDGNHLLFSACVENSDSDVYKISVNDGAITNLTPESRKQDVHPRWIQNGTQVFFLSIESSAYSCDESSEAPHQMKLVNTDGSGERVIYRELYYPFVSVSNSGRIAFVSDMVSMNWEDYFSVSDMGDRHSRLYRIAPDEAEPIEIPTDAENPVVYSWSPDGQHLIYKNGYQDFKILNIETGEVRELPPIEPSIESSIDYLFDIGVGDDSSPPVYSFSWSPDGQQIAVTGYLSIDKGGIGGPFWSLERHIYILSLQDGTARPLIQE